MKNKLAQKSSGTQSEETVLLKSFKYFDLNNNGTVEPEEFAKAIEKIGIMIPTKQVSPLPSNFHLVKFSEAFSLFRSPILAKILIKIFIYRILTLSSAFMMLIEVELLTIKSLPLESLEHQPKEAHHKRAVVELVETPRIYLKNLGPN